MVAAHALQRGERRAAALALVALVLALVMVPGLVMVLVPGFLSWRPGGDGSLTAARPPGWE